MPIMGEDIRQEVVDLLLSERFKTFVEDGSNATIIDLVDENNNKSGTCVLLADSEICLYIEQRTEKMCFVKIVNKEIVGAVHEREVVDLIPTAYQAYDVGAAIACVFFRYKFSK